MKLPTNLYLAPRLRMAEQCIHSSMSDKGLHLASPVDIVVPHVTFPMYYDNEVHFNMKAKLMSCNMDSDPDRLGK
jgi:hypothetical protein